MRWSYRTTPPPRGINAAGARPGRGVTWTAPPRGRLVLRFRSSHHFAAPSRANFGSKGALANSREVTLEGATGSPIAPSCQPTERREKAPSVRVDLSLLGSARPACLRYHAVAVAHLRVDPAVEHTLGQLEKPGGVVQSEAPPR